LGVSTKMVIGEGFLGLEEVGNLREGVPIKHDPNDEMESKVKENETGEGSFITSGTQH